MHRTQNAALIAAVLGLALPLEAQEGARTRSETVTTPDGAVIHYLEAGWRAAPDQPALVFVPGWTMPAEIWEHQLAHFGRTHRAVAMDPRGQGRSSKVRDGYYPEQRARDIRSVVEQLGLEPIVLVGWSMGVPEALAYIQQFGTSRMAGLVLVDGIAGGEPSPQVTHGMMLFARRMLTDREEATEAFVRSMYRTPQSEQYLRRITAAALQTPTDAAVALFVGIQGTDYRAVLPLIDRPTMIAYAPGSMWEDEYRAMHAATPESSLAGFEGAGHALFVDHAAEFNRMLREFLVRLTR